VLGRGWSEVEVGGATNASAAQAAHEVGDRGADLVHRFAELGDADRECVLALLAAGPGLS
jgi:hypothetical protein